MKRSLSSLLLLLLIIVLIGNTAYGATPISLYKKMLYSERDIFHLHASFEVYNKYSRANEIIEADEWFTNYNMQHKMRFRYADNVQYIYNNHYGMWMFGDTPSPSDIIEFNKYGEFPQLSDDITELIKYNYKYKISSVSENTGIVTYRYKPSSSYRYLELNPLGIPVSYSYDDEGGKVTININVFEKLQGSNAKSDLLLPKEAMDQINNGISRELALSAFGEHVYRAYWLGSKTKDLTLVNISGGSKERRGGWSSLYTYLAKASEDIVGMSSIQEIGKSEKREWRQRGYKPIRIGRYRARYKKNGEEGIDLYIRVGKSLIRIYRDYYIDINDKELFQILKVNLQLL